MEVVLVLEFEADDASQLAALLERVGPLTLKGQAKLSFVGLGHEKRDGPARRIVAIGLARSSTAETVLQRWRTEGVLSPETRARIFAVEPIWSMEPLALMFP